MSKRVLYRTYYGSRCPRYHLYFPSCLYGTYDTGTWCFVKGTNCTVSTKWYLSGWLNDESQLISVADLGCLFRIPNTNIFHHGSRVKKIPGSASKNLSIITQKIVSNLSEIWAKMFIPDPDLDFYLSRIPDSGSKRHWIRNTAINYHVGAVP